MVVTRKGTSTPMPPNSRTASSTSSPKLKPKKTLNGAPQAGSLSHQPVPQPAAGAASHARLSEKPDPVGPEFDDPMRILPSPKKSPAKPKSKSKSKKAVTKVSRPPPGLLSTIFGYIRLIILVSLVSYTVVVCPHDARQESPVCNTLYDIRRGLNYYIVNPHVQPQIDKLLSHPQVAPVVRYAQPAVNGAAAVVKPICSGLNNIYVSYASPRIRDFQGIVTPYTDIVDAKYKETLEPYVLQAQAYGRVAGRITEPYIRLAVMSLKHSWVQVKPYLYLLGRYSLQVPGLARVHVINPTFVVLRVHVWRPLVELYYAYVDPHLTKMFETVEELGGDAKASPSASRFEKAFGARAAEARHDPRTEQIIDLEDDEEEDDDDDDDDDTMGTSIPAPTPAQTPLGSGEQEQTATKGAHVNPEEIHKLFDPVQNLDDVGEDELAAFLEDLNGSAGNGQPEQGTAQQPQETGKAEETPDDVAEKKRRQAAETAEKRKEIQDRHQAWEEKIDKLIEEQINTRLPESLQKERQKFVDELKELRFGGPIQALVDKTISNVEAYIKKIMFEKTGGAEKVALLDDLVSKVRKRFGEAIDGMSSKIVAWWEQARKDEGSLIDKLAKEVHDLAGTAQADIGLDYSWLDDVTVADWRRYHALVRKAETHKQQMIEIANGSDARAPPNALSVAMRELQLELQQIVLRFQNLLDETHKKALKKFVGRSPEDDADGTKTSDDPTMSILPVADEEGEEGEVIEVIEPEDDSIEPEVKHAFVGRSKDEVEDAVKRAEAPRDEL